MRRDFRAFIVAAVAVSVAGCTGRGQGGANDASTSGPWATVAVGAVHTVALRKDGTLWVFGGNDDGQVGDGSSTDRFEPVQVGTAVRWSAAAAGAYHTVALTVDGALYAWGRNAEGQLGDGTTSPRLEPSALATTARFTAVAAGGVHTLAIRDDGTLWAWGSNGEGQLGTGWSADAVLEPQPVATTATWRTVCAGSAHTLAIRTDGTLWAWGRNTENQLGTGSNPDVLGFQFYLAQVGTATTWTAVSAGTVHTVALRDDGVLWWWGYHVAPEPEAAPTTARFVLAVAGDYATIAVRDDGTAWGWGNFGNGRLGVGTSYSGSQPYPVADPGPFVALALGQHAAAVKRGGTLWTWGFNSRGQLGLGTSGFSENRTMPTSLGRSFTDLATRGVGAAGIAPDGTLWSWGSAVVGLGGPPDSALAPALVSTDTTWTALAGGSNYTVGLRGGALAGFGIDSNGQLGRGPAIWLEPASLATTATFTHVAAGAFQTVAIRDDGTLWTWGYDSYSGTSDPDPFQITTAIWSAVAAGGNNAFAIRSDGTLWAWGTDNFGTLGGTNTPPSAPVQIGNWSDWTAISASGASVFGIRSDGSLWGWGLVPGATTGLGPWSTGGVASLGQPFQVGLDTDWTEISASEIHVLGRRGGDLYAWGDNSYGQLGDGTLVSRGDPTRIGASTTWARVFAAQQSSYALGPGGELFVWGSNYDGQLGIGTAGKTHDRWVPTRVP
jgi:alpha-tubulin suppressor-like RCC1 family protein